MEMTRRRWLELGAAGLPLTALAACNTPQAPAGTGAGKDAGKDAGKGDATPPPGDQKPPVHDESVFSVQAFQTGQTGGLLVIEGLSTLVLSGHQKQGQPEPKAAAIALLDVAPAIAAGPHYKTLPTHYPTLKIPRASVAATTTAKPVAADLGHAYFSLAGMDVKFTPKTGPALVDPAVSGLSFQAAMTPAATCSDKWNSVRWLLDIPRDLKSGAKLDRNWRKSKYIHALLELDNGLLEDSTLTTSDPGGHMLARTWNAMSTERFFKEIVRHRLLGPYIHVTLTPRAVGPAHVIVVNGSTVRVNIHVMQLPAPFTGNPNVLTDLVAFYGLLDGGEPHITGGTATVPTYVKDGCSTNQSPECSCCPMGLIIDENWS